MKTRNVKEKKGRQKDPLHQKNSSKSREPLAHKHRNYLLLLSRTKNKNRRKHLIDAGETGEIKAVSECIDNVLRGNVHITEKQLNILRQYRGILRKLANSCHPVKKKKKILKQKGGFLRALLPMALNVAGELFGGLLNR